MMIAVLESKLYIQSLHSTTNAKFAASSTNFSLSFPRQPPYFIPTFGLKYKPETNLQGTIAINMEQIM